MRKIVCITTYPPRECGIATFAQDLNRAILTKFGDSYTLAVCAVESDGEHHTYTDEVAYTLHTSDAFAYVSLAKQLNDDHEVEMILVQHEFGLYAQQEEAFLRMLEQLTKPIILVFHTVLSEPSSEMYHCVGRIMEACTHVVVMTQASLLILQQEYPVGKGSVVVIPHGTHLISFRDKNKLKELYHLSGRRILSTFGLLSAGKSIETTLEALPSIIAAHPTVLFLIIGKTHPGVCKIEGERYRSLLEAKIKELRIEEYVRFVNHYLELPVLLEYLQLTDVYLFTSSDLRQAVSGTLVYAIGCGCSIVATPIPHTLELLSDHSGLIFDFKNSEQLAAATNRLLADERLRSRMKLIGLQKTAATAWENVAIAYTRLFRQVGRTEEKLIYSLPPVDTSHIRRMSRQWGIIQFSKGNRPNIRTGYTLDDTARALVALCQVVVSGQGEASEKHLNTYLGLIGYCQQADGSFLNYIDKNRNFTAQNREVNLEDSNGRAMWSLGYFISCASGIHPSRKEEAVTLFRQSFPLFDRVKSPRSMAFMLKGLYYYNSEYPSAETDRFIRLLADQLVACYRLSAGTDWQWFEAYLTYDNGILPEALLLSALATGCEEYKEVAKESFDFLLGKLFVENRIRVISNQGWLHKEHIGYGFGEQPVDVAGTVMALDLFYRVFQEERYLRVKTDAFNWFLGDNHLHQIVYNPATGGCYDGLEEMNVNLNQGSESSVCYLMARLLMSPSTK